MVRAQRHLNNDCDDEGRASVSHSLQAAEDRDSKHDEEVTEKAGQFYQESGT